MLLNDLKPILNVYEVELYFSNGKSLSFVRFSKKYIPQNKLEMEDETMYPHFGDLEIDKIKGHGFNSVQIYLKEKNRYCDRCNSKVEIETEVTQYPYYCSECDENMYTFETHEK